MEQQGPALLVVKNDAQQRTVNLHLAVVLDEAQFSKTVHKKAYPRSRRPHHVREGLLAEFRDHRLGFGFLSELSQQQKDARQTLLAGIEKVIDQIRLDARIAREKKRDERIGHFMLLVERPHHLL